MRNGNDIVLVRRNESKPKKKQQQQRGRSAEPSNKKNKIGRRSISEPPAYIQKAKQLPELNVVTENLSSHPISDMILKLKLQGNIRDNLNDLDRKHF